MKYDVTGFIDKNQDELSALLLKVLLESTNATLRELAEEEQARRQDNAASNKRKSGAREKKTVFKQFRESLDALITELKEHRQHNWVRCLKPNQSLAPKHEKGSWENAFMHKQLAYSGTLEVTKVRKAGLNVRQDLRSFYEHYKICAPRMKELTAPSLREQCVLLLQKIELDPATWRVGKTIVFMASDDVLALLNQLREVR